MKVVMVCGPSGAGKTTYAMALAKERNGVRFSIDSWMQNLFADDMASVNYTWIMERVTRCHQQIWQVSAQILEQGGTVVLDLGFTTQMQRKTFIDLCTDIGADYELHYLDAPTSLRKKRVMKRNQEKNPDVYAFDVTEGMFNFMNSRFEQPSRDELANGKRIFND